jgi:transposase
MGRKAKQLRNFTTEQVKSLFESDSNYLTGVKLFAMIQLTKGYSSRKLSEFYGISFKQICNWADRFDAEGMNGLRMKPGRGRHSFLSGKQKVQLCGDLLKSPENFGYHASHWTGQLIGEHIKQNFHVEYKQASVYKLMHQLACNFRK